MYLHTHTTVAYVRGYQGRNFDFDIGGDTKVLKGKYIYYYFLHYQS